MKRLFIIIAAVTLVSCTKLEIITDQYWNAAVIDDMELNRFSVKVVKVPVDRKKIPDLTELSLGSMPENILLSPLYSLQVGKLSKKYPEKHFFYFSYVFDRRGSEENISGISAVTGINGNLRDDRERIAVFIRGILKKDGETGFEKDVSGDKSSPE